MQILDFRIYFSQLFWKISQPFRIRSHNHIHLKSNFYTQLPRTTPSSSIYIHSIWQWNSLPRWGRKSKNTNCTDTLTIALYLSSSRQTHDPVKRNKQTHFPSCFYCLLFHSKYILKGSIKWNARRRQWFLFIPGEGNWMNHHQTAVPDTWIDMCTIRVLLYISLISLCVRVILRIFFGCKNKKSKRRKRNEMFCVIARGAQFFIDRNFSLTAHGHFVEIIHKLEEEKKLCSPKKSGKKSWKI